MKALYAFDWEEDKVNGKSLSNWQIAKYTRMTNDGALAFIYIIDAADGVIYAVAFLRFDVQSAAFQTIEDAKAYADNIINAMGYKTLPTYMKVLK